MELINDKFKEHKTHYTNVLDIFASELGMLPALFLSALIRKHDGLVAQEKKDKTIKFTDDGFFYCTQPDLENMFPPTVEGDIKLPGMTRAYQDKCIKVLESRRLITKDTRNRGLEKFRYFKLNEEEIMRLARIIPTDCLQDTNRLLPGDNPNGLQEALSNSNKIIESSNSKNKNTSAAAAVSAGQTTLFPLPSLEPPKKKLPTLDAIKRMSHRQQALAMIELATLGELEWDKIRNRDWAYYYITEHNKLFQKPIEFDQYKTVTQVRTFLDAMAVPKEKTCQLIIETLHHASISPECRDKWGCLSTNALIHPNIGQSYGKHAKQIVLGKVRKAVVNDFENLRKAKEPLDKIESEQEWF